MGRRTQKSADPETTALEPAAVETSDTSAAAHGAQPETPPPSAPASEPSADDEEHAVTLVRNATILTITDGEIANGEILIRDGRIAAVGREPASAPDRARVIDAGGGFVMPGIIDCHSHIAIDGGVNEGSVAVSSMAAIEEVIDPGDPDIYRALAGGVTTANVLHGSANPIGGTNAVIKLRWGTGRRGSAVRRSPAGHQVRDGREPEALELHAARRPGPPLPGDAHGRARRDPRRPSPRRAPTRRSGAATRASAGRPRRRRAPRCRFPPRRDLRLEPLVEVLEGKRLVHAHSYRADEILELMRLADELGFKIKTLQHVLEGYRVADEIARARRRRLDLLRPLGLQDRSLGGDPVQRRAADRARRGGLDQLGFAPRRCATSTRRRPRP